MAKGAKGRKKVNECSYFIYNSEKVHTHSAVVWWLVKEKKLRNSKQIVNTVLATRKIKNDYQSAKQNLSYSRELQNKLEFS